MMRTVTALIVLLVWHVSAQAGDLVFGGRLVGLTNTTSNSSIFAIKVTGGSLNLCSTTWISFPVSAAADADTHKRAYAAALTALTTGMPVRIHNYASDSCGAAQYIELIAE